MITNLLTKEETKLVSVVTATAKKHNETTRNSKSARVYYVLRGTFVLFQGKRKLLAKKGDIIFIPKNVRYTFGGTFEAVIINTPAFNVKFDKTSYK